MAVTSEVLQRGPARFDIAGQFKGHPIETTDDDISPGMVKRLVRYATQTLDDHGFAESVTGWAINVYTLDGDSPPAERVYTVRWINAERGFIDVTGIMTSKGWPFLDHGLDIGGAGSA